jgi:hypothetical protein
MTIFPPLIREYFSSELLQTPHPKLREDSETLWYVWEYIEKNLWKKLDKQPIKKARCELLKQIFMELYERAKIKEKEREKETRHPTQVPFYYIGRIDRQGEKAFASAKYRRCCSRDSQVGRRYGKIYKIQAFRDAMMKEYGRHVRINA